MKTNYGKEMYQWAGDLFPINRSLTGNGVRQTLKYFKNILPDLSIHEVPSGMKAFDWTVPDEWNVTDAFVADESGKRIIDFQKHNLHLMGYSEPIDEIMSFEKLDEHLYSLPDQPAAIPFITSYYKRRWGFALTELQRNELRKKPNVKYHVKIDATLEPGHLTYGELIIPGKTDKEIMLSTYVCHPSMANNELSGPCVVAALAKWLSDNSMNQYTYRILFLVETIGSIVYLSKNLVHMKNNMIAGFVLTCVGDNRSYSYVESKYGNTLADKVAKHVLKHKQPNFKHYSFLLRGSDERQYCSPGVDLPVCSIMRSKYDEYPEYHNSLDNMSLISEEGLQGTFEIYKESLIILENNATYSCTVCGEPQLGKRGLYPSVSTKDTFNKVFNIINFLAYADGTNDLLDIADKIGVYAGDLIPIVHQLKETDLLINLKKI